MPISLSRILALWLAAFAFTGPAIAEKQSHYKLVQNTIDGYVVPRLQAFETASGELRKAVAAHCDAPTDAGRKALEAKFRDALLAWAELEVVRFGPVAQEGRAQRISFWPDPRGAVERQLRQLLAHPDSGLLEGAGLRGQSAALQGFPALEVLLADTTTPLGGTSDDSRFRCKFASAVAANIVSLSGELRQGWMEAGGWRDRMLRPGSDNLAYPSAGDAATDVVKSLATSMQSIIEAQIKPLTEVAKDKKARPSAQPYRRLGLSRDYLLAGLRGCRALYAAARLGSYLDPSDEGQARAASLVDTAFTVTEREVASPRWLATASGKDDDALRTARTALSMLGAARRQIATEVAAAAEVSLGFNELDGD